MPFPWKKPKAKRFSQLVTNHLHLPKRGSSLILETGFPASLADLFVKNRDRLNNYNIANKNNNNNNNDNVVNKRKKNKNRTTPPAAPISIPPPLASPDPGPSLNSSNLSTPSRIFSVPQLLSPLPSGKIIFCDDNKIVHDEKICETVNVKHIFVAVLKVFFVVVLALGAEKFALGVAISAFLLLFMEYIGGHISRLLVTSASAKRASLRLVDLLNKSKKSFEGYCADSIDEIGLVSDLDFSEDDLCFSTIREMEDLVSEIHFVQPRPNFVLPIREIPSVEYEFNLRNGKEKWATEEMEVIENTKKNVLILPSKLLLSYGRVTRRSKIKSKIKRIVNKLSGSKSKHKKKNANENNCDVSGIENATRMNGEVEERENEAEFEDDSTSIFSSSSGGNFDDDRVNIEDSICPENSSNNDKNNSLGDGGRDRSSSPVGYLAILFIVLVGLVGGRILALFCAVSCIFILKFGLGNKIRCITN